MLARRFLLSVLGLTLLAVAGGLAIFLFGDRALTRMATPRGHYQRPPPHSGPNYSLEGNWITRPGLAEELAQWRPVNDVRIDPIAIAANVFYIHPTTYLERDRWNAPLDDQKSRRRAELFVRTQASAFNQDAQIWAPRYRQAAFGAFLLDSKDAVQALDLAYADVARAFDAFIASIPNDSPIILAGHSQGALHLSRLLRERIAGKPIARRIVAVYVVGWPLSLRDDIPAMGLPACAGADEARCILSWQSFAEPANSSMFVDAYEKPELPSGGHRKRGDLLCVNPLTGTKGGVAPAAANPGTLVPTSDFSSAQLQLGRVGARCDEGLLLIDGEIPPLGPYVLPGNNYHVYDYALFWAAIRADAQRRLAAWTAVR